MKGNHDYLFGDLRADPTGVSTDSPVEENERQYARTQEGMDAAREWAKEKGLEIIEGAPNTLLLDLDDGTQIIHDNLLLLYELVGEVPGVLMWTSRGGEGKHVVLHFHKATFTPAEALALEAGLGSDPKRALLGVMRLKAGVEQPRMLFRPRGQPIKQLEDKMDPDMDDALAPEYLDTDDELNADWPPRLPAGLIADDDLPF